jgi:predicted site-specific integrase-resolvase
MSNGIEHAKPWLSVKEAALLINRAPSNLYRWISKGYLRTYKGPTGRMQVKRDDLLPAQNRAAEYETHVRSVGG